MTSNCSGSSITMEIRKSALALTLAGLVMAGCHKSSVTKTPSVEKLEVSDWAKKRRRGVDFTAFGPNPAWVLDMDFNKDMHFQGPEGGILTTAVPKSQPNTQGTGGIVFNAKGHKLRVAIEPVVLLDKASGRQFAYTVRIDAQGKQYTGGGAFLNGASRLNSTWILETFRGQRFHVEQFANRQMPFIEVKWKEKQLAGFAGCNRIQGKVKGEADNVQFEAITTSGQTCPSSKFESGFLATLKKVNLYRISKNRLTLLADGQYVMTFRKGTDTSAEVADGRQAH